MHRLVDMKIHVPSLQLPNSILGNRSNKDIIREANIRLCRLRTWPNYKGLGFYIIKRSQPPSIIGLVESNSPAAAGGLKIWDTLLAVNDVNVIDTDYRQVVITMNELKKDPHRPIELLVVEHRFYENLKKKNITIDFSLATVLSTPIKMPDDYIKFRKHVPRICRIKLHSDDINFGFDVINASKGIGMYIQEVIPNSPAYQAGLRKSDRIIEIDDIYVNKDRSKLILEKLNKAIIKRSVKLLVEDTVTYEHHLLNNQNTNKDNVDSHKKTTMSSGHASRRNSDSLSVNTLNQCKLLPPTHEYVPLHNHRLINTTSTSLDDNKSSYEEPSSINYPSIQNQDTTSIQSSESEHHEVIAEYEYPDEYNFSTLTAKEKSVSTYMKPSKIELDFDYRETKEHVIKDSEHDKVNQRFFDVQNEPLTSYLPIEGYEALPKLPLNSAIENLENIIPKIKRNTWLAIQQSSNPTDGLTSDESASIYLYTMEWRLSSESLSMKLNDALRSTDRVQLTPYLPYLKLVLSALEKLKNINAIVWRGVKVDLRDQYKIGNIFVWWGFSSCVESQNLLESDKYLGKQGVRTIFNIECKTGKSIRSHSYYKHDNEILLLPAIQLQVIKQDKVSNNLYIIYLKEIQASLDTEYSLVSLISSCRNEYLQKFIDNHKMENSISFSELSLTINDMHLIANELHTNKYWCRISFYRIPLTEEHIEILMHALKSNQLDDSSSSLKNLDLIDNQITDIGAVKIALLLQQSYSSLAELNISENPLEDAGVISIAQALIKNTTLIKLHLDSVKMTNDSLQELVKVIRTNNTLKYLSLKKNDINDDGMILLLDGLQVNNALTYVDLNNNKLTDRYISSIAAVLNNNPNFKCLHLSNNSTTEQKESPTDNETMKINITENMYY